MKTNYDLYYIALEDHYKELEKLFLFNVGTAVLELKLLKSKFDK